MPLNMLLQLKLTPQPMLTVVVHTIAVKCPMTPPLLEAPNAKSSVGQRAHAQHN
jgi:hypothetical protein